MTPQQFPSVSRESTFAKLPAEYAADAQDQISNILTTSPINRHTNLPRHLRPNSMGHPNPSNRIPEQFTRLLHPHQLARPPTYRRKNPHPHDMHQRRRSGQSH